jgi:NADH dehydrogenase
MKILVAGGTGFVGGSLIRNLIEDGFESAILIRSGSQPRARRLDRVSLIRTEYDYPVISLDSEFNTLINCVGIIREIRSKGITFEKIHCELVKYLIDLARANGIKRFIQISALGVGPEGNTEYLRSKYRAEEMLAISGLNVTIFRPSAIFGPDDDFINMLAGMIRRFPLMPVIGDGEYRLQPVHIDDLCRVIIKSMDDDFAFGKTFEMGGPEVLSYNGILEIIESISGRKIFKIHQPVAMMRLLAGLFGRFSWFPVTRRISRTITAYLNDTALIPAVLRMA